VCLGVHFRNPISFAKNGFVSANGTGWCDYKMTSTTAIKMPTSLHFIKVVKEVREYTIRHELTYPHFVSEYMVKTTGESDEHFKTRCDDVWDGMCSKIEWKHKDGAIDLGDCEIECGNDDEWEGDVEDEFEGDICDLVERYDNRPIITAARLTANEIRKALADAD